MVILPAIDIQAGTCVRLFQGDFSTAQKVAENPLEAAKSFQTAGARWVHMVDLDGAKEGSRANAHVFLQVAKESGLKVELGGGIRSREAVAYYLENGISRVILGSAAVNQPALVIEVVREFGGKIAVGIDAKNGMVATEGWLNDSGVPYLDLAKKMEQAGVQYLIFPDISRDGTLTGLNLEQLDAINRAVSCNIIASGGVRSLEDIEACEQLGLYGVICGKSIYQGTLDLAAAIGKAGEQGC